MKKLSKETRESHFIEENGEQAILGELIVAAKTDRQRVPTTVIPLSTTRQIQDDPEMEIIQKATSLPQCWNSIRKHLLLVCVCMPTTDCLRKISEFLTEKQFKEDNLKNKLVIYIANVPCKRPEVSLSTG